MDTAIQFKTNATTLYRKNALGVGVWSIWSDGFDIIMSHASTLDGAQVQHREHVKEGKQSRTREEQVAFRIASPITKQKEKDCKLCLMDIVICLLIMKLLMF